VLTEDVGVHDAAHLIVGRQCAALGDDRLVVVDVRDSGTGVDPAGDL
jgi:hypothetical protein